MDYPISDPLDEGRDSAKDAAFEDRERRDEESRQWKAANRCPECRCITGHKMDCGRGRGGQLGG